MPAREGSLEAPTRHSLDWTNPRFYDEEDLFKELERVFDIQYRLEAAIFNTPFFFERAVPASRTRRTLVHKV